MDIFEAFSDPALDDRMKTIVMLQILYPGWMDIPPEHLQEAIQKASEFIDCGQKPDGTRKKKTMDWIQDADLIIPAINTVAKREVRSDPNIHWWTFFGWYMSISEGLFPTVLRIRAKLNKRKKLEKWEEDFYKENRRLVDLESIDSKQVREEKDHMLKFL